MRPVMLPAGTLATVLLWATAACVQRIETPSVGPAGALVAPTLVLEHFLRASNAVASNDTSGVITMGRLFGTKDGPITGIDEPKVVEQRMFLIASILKHDDYRILGEQIVPGRLNEARQLNVEIAVGPRKVTVPFTMVRSKGDNWLVEKIDVETITRR